MVIVRPTCSVKSMSFSGLVTINRRHHRLPQWGTVDKIIKVSCVDTGQQ